VTYKLTYKQVNLIRKISVGPDYMKCMHYVVGQRVLRDEYEIESIIKNDDGSISIWIMQDGAIVCWKNFSANMPISTEYKIDF
jgi:hypothetical protein